jgi:Mor family transcriptional regulator
MSGVVHAQAGLIVELLGVELALKFVAKFGGRRLYLPQPERLDPNGPIVATVGSEAAKKIACEWRGLEIMVPKCSAWVIAERNRQIHCDAATMSASQVAEKYGLTERSVFKILKSGRRPTQPRGASNKTPSTVRRPR